MNRLRGLEPPIAESLVFSFYELLHQEGNLNDPEADFLEWVGKVVFADLAICSDNADDKGIGPKEREAWRLYGNAIQATCNLLDVYKNDSQTFQKVARQLSFLPVLMSWHPHAAKFNQHLYKSSGLGVESMYGELRLNPKHLVQQRWPVRYAYAIIATIELTLDTCGAELPDWSRIYGHGVRHYDDPKDTERTLKKLNVSEERKQQWRAERKGAYRILPEWTKGLIGIRRPFSKQSVPDYWQKGKEILLEEMPEFHLRPEWEEYREKRNYKDGRKAGSIRSAIFKDISAESMQ